MSFRSSDGKTCKVSVLVGRNKKVMRSTLNRIADSLRIDHRDIERWLESGTHEELMAHLERYPAEVFESPPSERRFREYDKPR